MSTLDIILFTVAVVAVIAFGIWKGTSGTSQGSGASGYFLAGRGLTWWLVGFSLIAAYISTEQFVGMSGQAADWLGMAIASYEWMAAITLVVVAFVFLPKLLRCGIYTVPEFLEHRFGPFSRTIMAVATMVIRRGNRRGRRWKKPGRAETFAQFTGKLFVRHPDADTSVFT